MGIRQRFFSISMSLMLTVSIMSSLVATRMWFEYRSYRESAQELHALQEEYRSYLSSLKNSLQSSVDSSSEQNGEKKKSFIILDRSTRHLRTSCEEYVRRHQDSALLKSVRQLYESPLYIDGVQRTPVRRAPQRIQSRATRRRPASRAIVYKDIVLSWPIDKNRYWLSSFFGPRKRPNGTWGYHYGLDMAAPTGTPVKSAAAGRVIEAGCVQGYGNTIVISHNNTYSTRYAHLNSICVKKGETIRRGQRIGTVGATGSVRKSGNDPSHLHLEVYRYQRAINPMAVLA